MSKYLNYLKKRTADYLASETLSIETSTAIAMIEAQERQAESLERIAASLEKLAGSIHQSHNGVPAISINDEYLEYTRNLG